MPESVGKDSSIVGDVRRGWGGDPRFVGTSGSEARALEAKVRGMYHRSALNRWPIGPTPRHGDTPLLVAWPREPLVELDAGVRPARASRHAMLICECNVVAGAAPATFTKSPDDPSYDTAPVLLARSRDTVDFYRGYSPSFRYRPEQPAIGLRDADVVYAFVPSIDMARSRAIRAGLFLHFEEPDRQGQVFRAAVYNHVRRTFDNLDGLVAKDRRWVPLRPAEHVSPIDGRVVARLSSIKNPDPTVSSIPIAREGCLVRDLDVSVVFEETPLR